MSSTRFLPPHVASATLPMNKIEKHWASWKPEFKYDIWATTSGGLNVGSRPCSW